MNKVFTLIFAAMAGLALSACSGTIDPESEVPEGVLRIFADKTEILADGNDEVTFKVMFGNEDVSNSKTLQLVRTFEGQDKYMSRGVNKFSTVTAGTYKFRAEYYYEGNHKTDNEVEVVAEQFFSGEEKNFKRRFLGLLFTSTGCTSCPLSSQGIKDLQASRPGEISVASFHKDYSSTLADPMTVPETAEFASALGGFSGLPAFFWNMRKDSKSGGGANESMFAESLEKEEAAYQTYSGISVSTTLDGTKSKLDIEVGVTSNNPSVFRYLVILVEDAIPAVGDYEQQSNSNLGDYKHNNVVRKALTSPSGDKLNDNLPLTVGVEAKAVESVEIQDGWNVDNMRVIVAGMTSDDGGINWTVNNVNECKAGESSPYLYEE